MAIELPPGVNHLYVHISFKNVKFLKVQYGRDVNGNKGVISRILQEGRYALLTRPVRHRYHVNH